EQARTTYRVVVVVLAINLLVVIATTQSVGRESLTTVGVGKSIVANRNNAWHEQRQVIKPLVFLDARKCGKCRPSESVGHLRLSGLNQWGSARNFNGRTCFADRQFHGAQAAVASGSHQNVALDGRLESLSGNFHFIFASRNQI